ncbi:MAG: hypothetical protein ABSG38_12210 [Spirochaetia bacterium]
MDALEKTERDLPGLTDWVLWTRRPLTKGDQKWFYSLKTPFKLRLWTADDVEQLLTGDAEMLRRTYFGELVLSPAELSSIHKASAARIRRRWIPEVHQEVDAERTIRQMLAERKSWDSLSALANRLKIAIGGIENSSKKVSGPLSTDLADFARTGNLVSDFALRIGSLLESGDLALLRQELIGRPTAVAMNLAILPRKLRARRLLLGLSTTNALADIRLVISLLEDVDNALSKRLVAVLAGAGGGKTQLAAQLTSSADDRPSGLLLHGQDLRARDGLDDLSRQVSIQGVPVQSMEALLAAVDAAGQRSHKRLPVVIDGLNEAEDPRRWKGLLAALIEIASRYPHVLVVCTVRHTSAYRLQSFARPQDDEEPSFANETLPENATRLDMPDFGHDAYAAIGKYFQYYKIRPADAEIPFELLTNPLTLRLFCEVTNSKRERIVGIEAMPTNLTGLFERYLDQVAERISELAAYTRRYLQQDVRAALDRIGWALWEKKDRSLDLVELQELLGERGCLWNDSIVRALEEDGVLLRAPGRPPNGSRVQAAYDLLGGHLVGKALLGGLGRDHIEEWLKEPSTLAALSGSAGEQHPLVIDIFRALVGLVPRQLHGSQLWTILEEPLRSAALRLAASLEAQFLDGETVAQLSRIVRESLPGSSDLLKRLRQTRSAASHPLNAHFLDGILREMPMATRDVGWTEWVRKNRSDLSVDIERFENRWKSTKSDSVSDSLRACWMMWTLTSTVRILRDTATRALYWFGQINPSTLFKMTLEALGTDDPYVPERMLAASYGVAMAIFGDRTTQDINLPILTEFALNLFKSMFAEAAPHSTTHAISRDFARHIIAIALVHRPELLDPSERELAKPPFRSGGIRDWGEQKKEGDDSELHYGGPLGMDFFNYTLGHLVPDRHNYDFKHAEYRTIAANILWRMAQLGYTPELFDKIDREISSENWGPRSEENAGRIDRYGKKYSWIAYYELYGHRYDKGLLKGRYDEAEERPSDIDIDPSFPTEPLSLQVVKADWLGNRAVPLKRWIDRGGLPKLSPYLVVRELNGRKGPWVLLDGHFRQTDMRSKRAIFAYARGLLIAKGAGTLPLAAEKHQMRPPDVAGDYYTFYGEIPWSDTFPPNGTSDLEIIVGRQVRRDTEPRIRLYRGKEQLSDDRVAEILKRFFVLKRQTEKAFQRILKAEGITSSRVVYVTRKTNVPKVRTVQCFTPVRENRWESYHSALNPGRGVTVLTREIAESLDLRFRLPDWDLYDSKGEMASTSIEWGSFYTNGQSGCFLRKDLLLRFLQAKRLQLIWIVWGEREVWMKDYEKESSLKIEHWRKRFQQVFRYDGRQIRRGESTEVYN